MFQQQQQQQNLLTCFQTGNINSQCIMKTMQLTILFIVLLLSFVQIYRQTRTYQFVCRWKMISLGLMIGTLIVNIAFCIWNTMYQLYPILSYLDNLYFLVIVAYVCHMYIDKNDYNMIPWLRKSFKLSQLLLFLLNTSILISALITYNNQELSNNSCEQLWYLCINLICFVLCLVALIVLYVNQREEKCVMQKYLYDHRVNNPLRELWIWMGINVVGQVIDLIETGLLLNAGQEDMCMIISSSEIGNTVLMFVFEILTLIPAYLATLWYYEISRKKVKKTNQQSIAMTNQAIQEHDFNGQRYFVHLDIMDSLNDRFLEDD